MLAITTTTLGKTFSSKAGPVHAVRDVTFDIAEGEVVGLLGPNGAGKTTTLRMLATLEQPTRGSASVAGHDLRLDPRGVRASIGLVAQSGGTRLIATARDEIAFQARVHRLRSPDGEAARMIKAFRLDDVADRPSMTLSGGQRRRLDLAIGLVHRPAVLFLDEPSAALDPPSRIELWEHLRALKEASGTTVVLSTHHLDEADTLCDRLLVLDRGKLIAEDSPALLKQRLGRDVITLDLGPDVERGRKIVADMPEARTIGIDGGEVRVGCVSAEGLVTRIAIALRDAGVEVRAVRVEHPTLDDVFIALTGRTTDGEQ
jgi:ABC-2 type transport system ATP-binding protein